MSFFSQHQNFFLEICNFNSNSNPTASQSTYFPVYNCGEWKLSPLTKRSQQHIMAENLLKFNDQLLAHNKPFGIIVSSVSEVILAAKVAHFLYIPGELCRQSDILEACQNTSLPIFIEKGNFLAPSDLIRVAEKLKSSEFALIDCGTAYGYSDVILDPRSLFTLKKLNIPFGINISALLKSEETQYQHRPSWLNNEEFLPAFIQMGNCFGAQFYVANQNISNEYLLKFTTENKKACL